MSEEVIRRPVICTNCEHSALLHSIQGKCQYTDCTCEGWAPNHAADDPGTIGPNPQMYSEPANKWSPSEAGLAGPPDLLPVEVQETTSEEMEQLAAELDEKMLATTAPNGESVEAEAHRLVQSLGHQERQYRETVPAKSGPLGKDLPDPVSEREEVNLPWLREKSEVLKASPHGNHYKDFAIEPIEYIEANRLGYHEAAVVKYITRWKAKGGLADLQKARWYITRLIEVEFGDQT